MAKKSQSCPEFIQQMDWPIIILVLFLVIFLGGITFNHYFAQQQQLRWEKLEALKAEELAQAKAVIISEELLEQADLNQDGRVDTADYALLVQIITKLETDNNGQ